MGPRSGLSIVTLRTLIPMLLLGLAATPSAAQLFDESDVWLGFSGDPIDRSPRLVGMGRLSLVIEDRNHRITLWDFAQNPIGILDDSTSVFELRPSTGSSSTVHDRVLPTSISERQDFASQQRRLGIETWRRNSSSSAFGLIGDITGQQFDRPVDESVELRRNYSVPNAMPVIAGHFPYLLKDHLRFAIRMIVGYTSTEDRYRAIVTNSVGEYIDQDGDIGNPPDYFTPDEYSISTIGGGGGLGYDFGPALVVAAGYDRIGENITGTNSGNRYDSSTEENRPYDLWQASAVGRIGTLVEWGVDGHSWNAKSKDKWVFTISSGSGGAPLTGRGKRLNREEEGATARGRLRAEFGRLAFGAGGTYLKRTIDVIGPDPTDPTSFNAFLNQIHRQPAVNDTLVLPDSVISQSTDDRGWEVGGGASYSLSWRSTVAGVEYHRLERETESDLSGLGPRRTMWDVRAGAEMALNDVLKLRGGYIHRWEDQDELTSQNEFIYNGGTIGAGLRPLGARWSFEASYALEWQQADFGDPGQSRGSRQQGAFQIQWLF